ncbi:MAG: hypothetical protein WBF05_14075, partial [Anaerolineales bacterium]
AQNTWAWDISSLAYFVWAYFVYLAKCMRTQKAYAHRRMLGSAGPMLQICHEKAQAWRLKKRELGTPIGGLGGGWALGRSLDI